MTDRCSAVEPLHSAWLDDELAPADRDAVTAHLRRCQHCRAAVESLRRTRGLLRSLPPRNPPRTVATDAAEIAARRDRALAVTGRVAAASLLVVGLVGGAAFALGADPPPDSPVVRVPVEVYLADHLLHSTGALVPAPLPVEAAP